MSLKTLQQKEHPNQTDPKTGNPPISQKARAASTWITFLGALIDVFQTALPEIQKEFPDAKWIGKVIFVAGLAWLAWQRTSDAAKQE